MGSNHRLGRPLSAEQFGDWKLTSGAWVIHPVLILGAKVLIDAIPGMTQDVSWTIVNLGYMAVSISR